VNKDIIGLKNDSLIFVAYNRVYDKNSNEPPLTKWKYWIESFDTRAYIYDTKNKTFDTLNIQDGLNLLNRPDVYTTTYHTQTALSARTRSTIFKWTDNEIGFLISHKVSFEDGEAIEGYNNEDDRTWLMYNVDTKKWSKFVIPNDVFFGGVSFMGVEIDSTNVGPLASIVMASFDWASTQYFNHKWYFLRELSEQTDVQSNYVTKLIEYDTGYVSIPDSNYLDETKEGIFQEIGIRKVYPNPVSRGSVNADIMCYVRDLSKIEIGLYNLMGQKIMDLSENYEYSDVTHTIYTKFDVPIGLNNGVYYLNVRNGTERRTQPVVIMSGY
jgi:hypothetical protein